LDPPACSGCPTVWSWLRAVQIVVAWKDTREVRRAVADAMPFLKLAERVLSLPFRDGFDGAYAAKLTRAP